MNALVSYDSVFGNPEQSAQSIAAALGTQATPSARQIPIPHCGLVKGIPEIHAVQGLNPPAAAAMKLHM